MKYRKKPVVIDAVRLDLNDIPATTKMLETMGATPGHFDMPVQAGRSMWWRQTFPNGYDQPPVYSLMIPTLEGEMEGRDGDWIIKGAKGEFYPCKPDIFDATYEVVSND